MADLLAVCGTLAFFAVALGVVRLCDAIVGPDPEQPSAELGSGETSRATSVVS